MGLDYSAGCFNFRDVGEWLNVIAGHRVMPRGRLLRGGKLDHVRSASDIEAPGTIINLRRGRDQGTWLFGADELHVPADDGVENYETRYPAVRRWLKRVVQAAGGPNVRLPLMLHCTSGKDRTGVATAALLSVLGIDRELIVEEYLLSDGEVRREWIEQALDGLGNVEEYFSGIDRAALQRRFLQGQDLDAQRAVKNTRSREGG